MPLVLPSPLASALASALTPALALALAPALTLGACAHAEPTPPAVAHAHAPSPDSPGTTQAEALALAGADALRDGRPNDALAFAHDALRRQPFLLEAGLVKVEAHLALAQRLDARDFAERLARAHPGRMEAHYAFGKALLAIGRANDARDAFDRALDLAPDDLPSRLGLLAAVALITSYDLSVLVPMAETLMSDNPELRADILHQLAIGHDLRGHTELARALYDDAIAAGAGPLARFNLARLLFDTAGRDAARPHIERFLAESAAGHPREAETLRQLLLRESP